MRLLSLIITSPTEFENSIQNILNKPEYSHLVRDSETLMDKFRRTLMRKIVDFMQKHFSGANFSPEAPEMLSDIFMIIGIILLVALIIFVVMKTNKVLKNRNKLQEILGERIDEAATPQSLKNKASTLKEKGEYREAIRMDFIALLFLLHEKSLLYLDETKTNEEIYKYLMKENFFKLKEIKELMNIFNFIWYGNKACTQDMYNSWNSKTELLWNEVMTVEKKA
ncbi:hypothetical protein [Clostridium polynesiense]|uniref:hypothetical protein n=1 Tax=Clostridium polynesiense TaxID=1325933 RepID=UPI000590DBC7|nr:hypothetical protein [Clostridium polynesiense]